MKAKNWAVILVVGVLAVVLSGALNLTGSSVKEPGQYDSFASCITESGAKFYGAFWCPHCNDQKAAFGDSMSEIEYIECSLPDRSAQTAICRSKGIQSYPTWVFGDGTSETGFIPLEELSEKTGCSLPVDNL